MRGFTMILVVLSHVSVWGLGAEGYNTIFSMFRMPLFFFVSGYVFYKQDAVWNVDYTVQFLRKKVTVQLISPFLFFVVYCIVQRLDILQGLTSASKYGYWFTFALLEFFLIYIFFQTLFRGCRIQGKLQDILYIIAGLSMYVIMHHKVIGNSVVVETLGMVQWRYFLFFILGTLCRKYFTSFEYLLDHTPLFVISIICFVGFNVFPVLEHISPYINRLVLAVCGILIVFSLFRHYQENFSKEHFAGKCLQFIGRRTLDIYLIHFFFVYDGLSSVSQTFNFADAPFLSFVVSIAITLCVIIASIGVSQVLRVSQGISHLLFGIKIKK